MYPRSIWRACALGLGAFLTIGLATGGAVGAQAALPPPKAGSSASAPARPQADTNPNPANASGQVAPAARAEAPSLVSDLGTSIHIADGVMPNQVAISPDGRLAYVSALNSTALHIVDLQTRTPIGSIEVGAGVGLSSVSLNAAGTRAVAVIDASPTRTHGVAVIDLTTRSLSAIHTTDIGWSSYAQLTRDGSAYLTVAVGGQINRIDTATGEVLASVTLPTNNSNSGVLTADESTFIVGRTGQGMNGAAYATMNAHTLEITRDVATPDIWSYSGLAFDTNPQTLYLAEGGSRVSVLDPATGAARQRISVGDMMTDVVGSDALNRAYSPSMGWDMVMAADFGTGERSESFRSTPVGAVNLVENPVTGDLLTADRGYTGGEGSTVTLITRPAVTNPADVRLDAVDQEVTFSSTVTGIKRGNGGGVVWQRSSDGEAWSDIAGANGNEYTTLVTAENAGDSYRLRFNDDFWGIAGASEPATVLLPAPEPSPEPSIEPSVEPSPAPSVDPTPSITPAPAQPGEPGGQGGQGGQPGQSGPAPLAGQPSGGLAQTGASLGGLALLGATILAIGTGLIMRRRSA